ncbi:MAG TPA: PQQ-binding-like beta-propeller repeat protein [Pyrinomonadaceae bacterium]|nr:PQQ-binding-like beta-propeller repeat protein [Pyrinomonadaceae bacterium]
MNIIRNSIRTLVFLLLLVLGGVDVNAQAWSAKLDETIRFYQPTDVGAVIVGTKKSVYAVDGATGDVLWRRKDATLDENEIAPVPGTDLVLLSFEKDKRTRIEAIDILSGDPIWQSEKLKGAVMQMAVDIDGNLLAVVLARDAKGKASSGLKRKPMVHVLDLSTGDEIWKHELGSDIEMMPTSWSENEDVGFTLDNYHPPMFISGRLYLFYEGATSFEARNGKERTREKYKVNEGGLALTEAAPVGDEAFIYTSGRGHVRAISRDSGEVEWEAKDIGMTPELVLAGRVIYARTGGQFTRLKDGETVERGPYGVSAIDSRTGKVLWRYKGADKGITNIVLPDAGTIVIADRDDVISVDTANGKRRSHAPHKIKGAAFALLNERNEVVIGGREEIAAFDHASGRSVWRAKYSPPGRGLLRTIAAVAARAASVYFRYGGVATTAFRGVQIARGLSSLSSSLSWSGLAGRSSFSNLQALATNSARSYVTNRFRAFGVASRMRPNLPNIAVRERLTRRPSVNIEERLLDRLDPARQLERLSRFLWHRERLAALRGDRMYFYTDLKGVDGNGLAGVNIHTGATDRAVRIKDLDERFVTDEVVGILFSASGNRLLGYSVASGSSKFSLPQPENATTVAATQ